MTRFPYPVEDTGHLTHFISAPETHSYSHLEICIRLSGEADYAEDIIDGQQYKTPYPHVVYKIPGVKHFFHASDRREAVFFIYSAKTAKELADLQLLPDFPIMPLSITGDISGLLQRLNTLMASAGEMTVPDKIDLTCFAILEEFFHQRKIKENAEKGKIQKIASILQNNSELQPDFISIAKEYGFSERSFYRHWRKIFSVTPARYVMEQKMKRAAWLLTRTSMPIREIALVLHFRDDNSFSTTFKRFYSLQPKEFRKTNNK